MLLWKCDDRRIDVALTVLAAIFLVGTRFGLLASGPWEWDETIFSRGMLHFELAGHFPQPPGFPGLLALGHLLLPLAGTPYRALQFLSALTSVLALWPLAALGRKVAPAPIAALSALVILLLPGPWLFSVRGFSTMPATFFLLTAAALWADGLGGRRVTVFTLLLTLAFLVRPILLPTVGLLWLCGISQVKPLRRLLPGMVIGISLIGVAIAVMVHLEGGWSEFLAPFFKHASYHAYRLDWNTRVLSNYGLIKGVGGLGAAVSLLVVALVGLVAWSRKAGRHVAAAWICILVLTSTQLIMLQNRSYARYAVVVQMASAPLIAGAAALAPLPVAVVALCATGGFAIHRSLPLLREQHDEYFGAWKATVDAADLAAKNGWTVVIESEVYPFASYWWHVLEHRGDDVPPMVLSPRAPESWQGIDRPWVVATVHPHLYLESLVGRSTAFGEVSKSLEPMTQGRFLEAVLSENPPLPVGQWWSRNSLPDGSSFMWAGPQAELWLPPSGPGTSIGIELKPAPGDAPVRVVLGEESHELDGHAEARWMWFETVGESVPGPGIVVFSRARGYAPGDGDDRPLSVQIRDIVVRPQGVPFAGSVARAGERARLRLEVDSAYPTEVFAEGCEGFWVQSETQLVLTIDQPGRLLLTVSAPRPTPTRTKITIGSRVALGPVDVPPEPSELSIEVSAADIVDGHVELNLTNDPFVPSLEGQSTDSRQLGIVLHALEFIPDEQAPEGWWN